MVILTKTQAGYAAVVMGRPLLYLDVDGPLIPFGGREYAAPANDSVANPLLARVDPALGPRLLALGCDLVWATTWMDEANECVAPLLGLPPLPVMAWPDSPWEDHDARTGLHWKTRSIVAHASARSERVSDLGWCRRRAARPCRVGSCR